MLAKLLRYLRGFSQQNQNKVRPVGIRWKTCLYVEELQARALPSASPVSLVSGHLLIQGTAHNDTVIVTRDAHNHAKIDVTENGKMFRVNAAGVKEIDFKGAQAHDVFVNHTSLPAVVNGGAGNHALAKAGSHSSSNKATGYQPSTGSNGHHTQIGTITKTTPGNGTGQNQGNGNEDDNNGGTEDNGDNNNGSGEQGGNGQGEGSGSSIEARLSDPTGNTTARGKAEFDAASGQFQLEIHGGPASATLNILVDGQQIGTISTDANGNGEVELSNVSITVQANSAVTVTDTAGNTVLQGNFQNSQGSELAGQLIDASSNVMGHVEFNVAEGKFEISFKGGAANTTYTVTVDGNTVGQVTTDDSGAGELHLSGATFTAQDGSTVAVADVNGNTLLTGTLHASGQED